MNVITIVKKIVGDIIGIVTCHSTRHELAPSVRAASISSWGTACSPA